MNILSGKASRCALQRGHLGALNNLFIVLVVLFLWLVRIVAAGVIVAVIRATVVRLGNVIF